MADVKELEDPEESSRLVASLQHAGTFANFGVLSPLARSPAREKAEPGKLLEEGSSNSFASVSRSKKQFMTRSSTWSGHSVTSRRSETAALNPEVVATLHKLHERFLSEGSAAELEDTDGSVMDAAWGKHGSWQVYGDCPPKTETPLHIRDLCVIGHRSSRSLLESLGTAVLNTKGRKSSSDKVPGQDNLSVSRFENGWAAICVMDGHGSEGHWPATRAVRNVPFFLAGASCSRMLRHGEAAAALTLAFDKAQGDLEYRSVIERVDIQAAGCTAVCILWKPKAKCVYVATAGDSRAVLFAPGQGVLQETVDHKPSVPAEAERINKSGGEVQSTEFDDGFIETRIYIRGEDFPGISMTRSLGDLCVKMAGVVAVPEVVKWEVPPGALMLAASDGVWEFLETKDVVDMILVCLKKGGSFDAALLLVVEAARKAWKEHEGTYCDDISIALTSLDTGASVSAGGGASPCCEGIKAAAGKSGCIVS